MKYPDKRGWWRFQRKEDFYLLLIVGSGTHFEVADDAVLAEELGEDYDGTPREDNYHEMTNVKELGFGDGEWIFERPMRKEGSEMPVVETAPINAHANESDAMAPSANVGESPANRTCEDCFHCRLSNSVQVRCGYPRERQAEVVDLTTQSGWTFLSAAMICKHFEPFATTAN